MGFAVRLAVRPTLAAQKGNALYPIRRPGAMRGTLFRTAVWRRMRLAAGVVATRSLRSLRTTAGPCVSTPGVAMPSLAGSSVALLGGTVVAPVRMPFVGTATVTVASLTRPCALRTLARAARPTLSLLLRGRARIAAAGVGAAILTRQRHFDQPLDVAEIAELLAACDQRDRGALGTRARGAADAMHIGLRHVGQVEIDDVGDAVDIDAAGGDIGGDQRADFAGAEQSERPFAMVLRLVTVDGAGWDSGPVGCLCYLS